MKTLTFYLRGDFYECYDDNARVVATTLQMTLTKTREDRPNCGIPRHSASHYFEYLRNEGYSVLAYQHEEPKK